MRNTVRFYLSPLAAFLTLGIGIGCVRAADVVTAFFTGPDVTVRTSQPAQENIGVTSTDNFRSFEPNDARPVAKGRVLSCYDLTILPVWRELKDDQEFKDRIRNTTGVMNCSDMIEIEKVDLNFDGSREVVVRGKGPYLCDLAADCGFWIFDNTETGLRKLLAASDYAEVYGVEEPTQTSRTNGHADILLKGHGLASEITYRTYKFDGRIYAESRCIYEVAKYGRKGEGTWELIPCSEYEATFGTKPAVE
jgi:hypothetical protein